MVAGAAALEDARRTTDAADVTLGDWSPNHAIRLSKNDGLRVSPIPFAVPGVVESSATREMDGATVFNNVRRFGVTAGARLCP